MHVLIIVNLLIVQFSLHCNKNGKNAEVLFFKQNTAFCPHLLLLVSCYKIAVFFFYFLWNLRCRIVHFLSEKDIKCARDIRSETERSVEHLNVSVLKWLHF